MVFLNLRLQWLISNFLWLICCYLGYKKVLIGKFINEKCRNVIFFVNRISNLDKQFLCSWILFGKYAFSKINPIQKQNDGNYEKQNNTFKLLTIVYWNTKITNNKLHIQWIKRFFFIDKTFGLGLGYLFVVNFFDYRCH